MNTVLLANLIKIRWLAIAGQIFALVTVQLFFDFSIPITECLVVVFLSVSKEFKFKFEFLSCEFPLTLLFISVPKFVIDVYGFLSEALETFLSWFLVVRGQL